MPKTRSGERITWKEFFKRWGKGIEGITPLQQTKSSLMGQTMVLIGIIWGLVITFFAGQGWLFLILFGSLPITAMGFLGMWQKFKALLLIEKSMKEMEGGVA